MKSTQAGLICAIAAVLLWATSALALRLGGTAMPKWEFLALASGLAGMWQYAMRAMIRKPMRDAIIMPLPIILLMVLPFVLYGIVFPMALLFSRDISQAIVAALLNYLWPTLTMLFGVALVPGMKMTARLAVGIIMSILGVLLANWADIRELKLASGAWLPYLLGLTAGVLWGFYSALICRWRERMRKYSVVPMGFTLLGIIFAIVATITNQWQPIPQKQLFIILFIAIGPYGLGYLLWEKAGAKGATSTALGILGSAVPVSATICLSLADNSAPGWHIYAAAALLSLAAFVTTGIRLFPARKNQQS